MPDRRTIEEIVDRYVDLVTKGDVDGIVALYAEDATIEDPIGSEILRGRDAVRRFYEASAGSVTMKRAGTPRVAGNESATPLTALMGPEDGRKALDIISVMAFDDDGRVRSMRAFWSMDDLRPATAAD